jgi:hypothetical protein
MLSRARPCNHLPQCARRINAVKNLIWPAGPAPFMLSQCRVAAGDFSRKKYGIIVTGSGMIYQGLNINHAAATKAITLAATSFLVGFNHAVAGRRQLPEDFDFSNQRP